MNDAINSRGRVARWAAAAGLLAAGAVAGGVLAGTMSANAATSNGSSTSESSTSEGPSNFPAHGSSTHESQEKAVTGANADKAKAAAVKSVGGGTASAVTSTFDGGGYEVTVKKADGSSVEVHLDSSFAVEDHGGH